MSGTATHVKIMCWGCCQDREESKETKTAVSQEQAKGFVRLGSSGQCCSPGIQPPAGDVGRVTPEHRKKPEAPQQAQRPQVTPKHHEWLLTQALGQEGWPGAHTRLSPEFRPQSS